MPTSVPPDPITPPLGTAWDNTAAASATPGLGGAFSNDPSEQIVLPLEAPPLDLVTTPTISVVPHNTTLTAGVNYLVTVGTRAAPVTITLPDPGSTGQTVEVIDSSLQAETFPITINAGTKPILAGASTQVLNVNGSSMRLTYSGVPSTGWM